MLPLFNYITIINTIICNYFLLTCFAIFTVWKMWHHTVLFVQITPIILSSQVTKREPLDSLSSPVSTFSKQIKDRTLECRDSSKFLTYHIWLSLVQLHIRDQIWDGLNSLQNTKTSHLVGGPPRVCSSKLHDGIHVQILCVFSIVLKAWPLSLWS